MATRAQASLLAALLLAGCAAPAPAATPAASSASGSLNTPSAPPSTHPPSAPAAPSAMPDPSPLAVLAGEPWLVYSWYAPGKDQKDMFLVRPDGTGDHVILGNLPGAHASPSWSPDGSRIAFAVGEGIADDGLWTADADGSRAELLTGGGGACPDGLGHPSWSPDGSMIAFICYPDPNGMQGSVATFDLATGSVTRLVTVTWPEHLDGAPSWSPDGRSIAFSILHWDPSNTTIDGSLVAVMNATGGKARRITSFGTNMSDPDWSPDGTELATYSYDMGNMHTTTHPSNLYLIRPDGTYQRQITRSSVDGTMRIVQPRWSPDGTRIVCSVGSALPSTFTTDDLQLAFVDPRGGEPVLLSPIVHGSQPDLRPTP